jgi:hypothetical protein
MKSLGEWFRDELCKHDGMFVVTSVSLEHQMPERAYFKCLKCYLQITITKEKIKEYDSYCKNYKDQS